MLCIKHFSPYERHELPGKQQNPKMILDIVIVDDEQRDTELLEEILAQMEGVQVAAIFTDPLKAREYLQKNPPDCLFVDIEMPGLDGMELLKSLHKQPPAVFVTSYPEFALQSFEYEPVHFIVKPVNYLEVIRAVDRCRARLDGKTREPEYIFLRTAHNRLVKTMFSDIIFMVAETDSLVVFTVTGSISCYLTLKSIMNYLPSSFFQVHRSYIVNTGKIDFIEDNFIHIGNHKIPLGRLYKAAFDREVLKNRIVRR